MKQNKIYNIKLIVAYDGTNYFGSQKQKSKTILPTVQSELDSALKKVYKHDIKTIFTSRTDKGVHALGQVVNFLTNIFIPTDKIPIAINHFLPKDIRVLNSSIVDREFNARKNAKSKIYIYKINTMKVSNPFEARYSYHYNYDLDLKAMKKAAKIIEGKHDFKAFTATSDKRENTISNIEHIKINVSKNNIEITIYGRNFLYKMVRFIVGVLLEVGRSFLTLEDVKYMLKNGNREKNLKVVPAYGLLLKKINF